MTKKPDSTIESQPADMAAQKTFEKAARRARTTKPKPSPTSTSKAAKTPPESPPKAEPTQSGFFMDPDGLFHIAKKGDAFLPPAWICAPFAVRYRARGIDGLGWRTILEIRDRDGNQREVVLLDADIGSQDGNWHKALSDAGLKIHPRRRGELGQYLLLETDGAPRARIVEKTGWYAGRYVMPHRTIGGGDEPILYQGQDRTAAFSEAGTLDQWREHIGRYCAGNSRLILAVCAGLAAPLLPFSGIAESGGWHLYGRSSAGKTTALRVASSLHGKPADYMASWRNTGNAIEGTAARSNHALLCLDEISQGGQDAGNTAMMLANGVGKGRMRDNASMREKLTWMLLWLSTGEHAMAHYLEAAGLKPDPGMSVRQLDIEADAGAGLGLFETLHLFPDARAFAEHLHRASASYHGEAGIAWLEHLASHLDDITRDLPGMVASMAAAMPTEGAESQVLRALRRFGLLAVAGEMASQVGITGWKPGEATAGIRTCAYAWLSGRGGSKNLEDRQVLERFRDFLGRGGQSRFIQWERATDDRAPSKLDAVGYRREAGSDQSEHAAGVEMAERQEFYVTAEGFNEIFRGMDPVRAGKVLLAHGVLVPGEWKRGPGKPPEIRPYRREYLPGMGRRQCYRTIPNPFASLGDAHEWGDQDA